MEILQEGWVWGKDQEFSFGHIQPEVPIGHPSGVAKLASLLFLPTSYEVKSHCLSPMVA